MALRSAIATICLAGVLFGQKASDLHGTVATASGSPLAGVKVTAIDSKGNVAQSAASDGAGQWQLAVPAGRYELRFESSAFRPKKLKNVVAPQTEPGPLAPVILAPENAGQSSASDEARVVYRPVVDAERTHQADFITERQLSDLPINRRNYLNMAALTPGVAAVDDYVGITDAPLVQAPQSGLSFGGNNGRGNIFWLDGGENYINTGGVRPSISQEAIAEFHVARSNYSAEFGGGIGGIVNIVSKAGSNDVHGNLFGFLRHRSMQARNYFYPEKGAYTRSQVGGTIGAPIRRDRTFLFLSFERLNRQESAFVPVGRDRGPFHRLRRTQDDVADFFDSTGDPQLIGLAAATRQLLLTDNFPETLALFNANRGILPFSEANNLGSARLDHRFSDNHNAFLRVNAAAGNSQNAQIEGFSAFSRGIVSDFSDQTLMVNDTYVLSARLVSESRLSLNRTRFNIGNRDRIGPSIDIAGYGLFGKDWTLPGDSGEWHGQAQQNFFYNAGHHSIRFGADINPVRAGTVLRTNSGGRFVFGEYLPLGGFYNFLTGDPNTAANLASLLKPSLVRALGNPLTAIQAFNIGAPGVYIQGFGDGTWHGWFERYNFFFNDVIRIHPRVTLNVGMRYELEAAPSVLGTDANNVSPRLGLAWAVTGDRRTVVRAGYGLFYLRHQSQIAAASELEAPDASRQVVVPLSGLPGAVNPRTGNPVNSADIYQTLVAQGVIGKRAIQASDLTQFGIFPRAGMPFQVFFQKPVDFVNAYAQQASVEVERAFGGTAISLAYNFNRAAHLPRLRDLNAAYGPPGALGLPTIVPRNPLVGQSLIYESAANSFYHSLIVHATRRYRGRLTLDAHYAFGKSIDEATDINFLPDDSLNTRKERGLSTFDQRHRVVGSAVLSVPGRFTVAPVVVATSGRPFNVVTSQDPNARRPAGAGRNIGQGPSFFGVDMRVSRTIALDRRFGKERLHMEIIAEGFNLLNRTNFKRLNNTADAVTVDDLPRPLTGVRGEVEDPLSFMSAFDSRQIQLGLKLRW